MFKTVLNTDSLVVQEITINSDLAKRKLDSRHRLCVLVGGRQGLKPIQIKMTSR